MLNRLVVLLLALTCFCHSCRSGGDASVNSGLQSEIEIIISGKAAEFGIYVIGPDADDTVSINGYKLYPTMSTFKFPVALAVLNKVEKGELSITQNVWIKKEYLRTNTWSPYRDKFPEGNVYVPLHEVIEWMMIHSDNNMTDILLELAGGPQNVERFIADTNIVIRFNEFQMNTSWESQFVNRTTPHAMTQLLKRFSEGKILNSELTAYLFKVMASSQTGVNRIRGLLPDSVIVAQRSGTSHTNDEGLTGAVNNIAIIELPDGKKVFVSVFVYHTTEDMASAERIMADIGQAVWSYYSADKKKR